MSFHEAGYLCKDKVKALDISTNQRKKSTVDERNVKKNETE